MRGSRFGVRGSRKQARLSAPDAGFALVEALVAAAIVATVLAAGVGAFILSRGSLESDGPRLAAAYLADEGIEAVRTMRDSGWSANIASESPGTPFYLAWSGSAWQATSTDAYVDGAFERSVVLESVYRDANGDIAPSGTLDNNARKITVTVSWQSASATSSVSLSDYLTNLFNN